MCEGGGGGGYVGEMWGIYLKIFNFPGYKNFNSGVMNSQSFALVQNSTEIQNYLLIK